jgi:hypothetical protein
LPSDEEEVYANSVTREWKLTVAVFL